MECEICHGSRWKSVTVDGVERLTRCDCWRGEVVEKLLKDARVPTRYARCELATFEHDMNTQREAWRRATRFVEAFPAVDKGLLLFGPHRSEERRVGKECRCRWSPCHEKKNE